MPLKALLLVLCCLLNWQEIQGFIHTNRMEISRIQSIHRIPNKAAHVLQDYTSRKRNHQTLSLGNSGIPDEINGEDDVSSIDGVGVAQICRESIDEYEEVMDHFMFELGNDIIFLPDVDETSSYIEKNFDATLFSIDGVLCSSQHFSENKREIFPEAYECLKSLLENGKKVLYMDTIYEEMNEITHISELNQATILKKELLVPSSPSLSTAAYDRLLNLLKDNNVEPRKSLFVTDRMDSGLQLAKEVGMKTALVLTGFTNAEKLIQVSMSQGLYTDIPFPQIIFPHVGLIKLSKAS